MKAIKILSIAIAAVICFACESDKFENKNINPDSYNDLAILFPGDSKIFAEDYDVNETLKCKMTIIAKNGLKQFQVGKILGSNAPVMEDITIPKDNKNLFNYQHEILADENLSVSNFKGIKVVIKDEAGNVVEDIYSITGKIKKDPKNIKYRDLAMTLNLNGIYPNMTVDGQSYFSSTASKPLLTYQEALNNQDKIDFILVGDIDGNFQAGGGYNEGSYPFGLFTPNRASDKPKFTGLYQKNFTQSPDVYMSYAFNLTATDFDNIYAGKMELTDAMLKYLTAHSAAVNDKGWVWLPAGGVLFFRIGGGTISQLPQAFNPTIRWGLIKFSSNWGADLCHQTALISVIVQRPETSGLPSPQ